MEREDVLAEMEGVREYGDRSPVQLVRRQQDGRVVVRAYNEGGNNFTEVDLLDLLDWLKNGPKGVFSDGNLHK